MSKENAKQEKVMRSFSVVQRLYNREVEKAIEEAGVHSSHYRLLTLIDRDEILDSQTVMAEELGISPAAVAMTLKRLVKNGIVNRVTDEYDSRKNRITLTEKGKALLAATQENLKKTDDGMFEGLSGDEMKVFGECLEKIEANLRNKEEN